MNEKMNHKKESLENKSSKNTLTHKSMLDINWKLSFPKIVSQLSLKKMSLSRISTKLIFTMLIEKQYPICQIWMIQVVIIKLVIKNPNLTKAMLNLEIQNSNNN